MVLIEQGQMSNEAKQTALFVKEMDILFDLMNSSFFGRPGRSPILPKKMDAFMGKIQFYIEWISSWSFLSLDKNKSRSSMPFQKGWILTLTNIQSVVKKCFLCGIPRVCTRRLNQDFLEVSIK